ncbi:MAG: Flp pilus assembly protein CpaB [Pseudomonadota bacterium]
MRFGIALVIFLVLYGLQTARADLLELQAGKRMITVEIDAAPAGVLAAAGKGAEVTLFHRSDAERALTAIVDGTFLLGIEDDDGTPVAFLEVSPAAARAFARSIGDGRFILQLMALPSEADARKTVDTGGLNLQTVYVVRLALSYGHRLTKEGVEAVEWPVEGVPNGAFTEFNALFPQGEEARTVTRAMERGEAFLASRLTEPGEDAGVSAHLTPWKRAFALRVDVSSGVSGFLRPSDLVACNGRVRMRRWTVLPASSPHSFNQASS